MMEKKEIMMGLIDIFDENQRLREENKILKVKAGLEMIDSTKAVKEESVETELIHILKMHYLDSLYSIKDKARTAVDDGVPVKEWIAKLDKHTLISYHEDIEDAAGLKQIKAFFDAELKQIYNDAKTESACASGSAAAAGEDASAEE